MRRRTSVHRTALLLAMLCAGAGAGAASASPPLDRRPAFFAARWVGTAADGAACVAVIDRDARGRFYVQVANGDWQGVSFALRNVRESPVMLATTPVASDRDRRLEPLDIGGGFALRRVPMRDALEVRWRGPAGAAACTMRRDVALNRALDTASSIDAGEPQIGLERHR